jgi:hypothetical protein
MMRLFIRLNFQNRLKLSWGRPGKSSRILRGFFNYDMQSFKILIFVDAGSLIDLREKRAGKIHNMRLGKSITATAA